jgi:hypothetical protein
MSQDANTSNTTRLLEAGLLISEGKVDEAISEFQKLIEEDKLGLYHRFGHREASSPGEGLAKTWGHTGL